jgi:hypothetical protein
MGQEFARIGRRRDEPRPARLGGGDFEELVPAALFRCLDDGSFESGSGAPGGLCHAAVRGQGHKPANSQLDGLLDEPPLAVTLGKRHAQVESKAKFAVDFPAAEDHQDDFGPSDSLHAGGKLAAGPVEHHDFVAGSRPQHVGQVARFGGAKHGRGTLDRRLDEETARHAG